MLGVMVSCSCENMGWIFQKYDNNRQKKLILMILPCADLVQSKKNTEIRLQIIAVSILKTWF